MNISEKNLDMKKIVKLLSIFTFGITTVASGTVVCISLETRSFAKQLSVAVRWEKIKISLMAQLKGLTAKFKLM